MAGRGRIMAKSGPIMTQQAFWKTKTLAEMSEAEWESLCDGCGKCCLHKLEDVDTGDIAFTNVACRLLDLDSVQCRDYPNRKRHVPDCVKLGVREASSLSWLPDSCSYRLVARGQSLPDWHPLVTGDPGSVHKAGASVRGKIVSEDEIGDLEDYVTGWLSDGGQPLDRVRVAKPPRNTRRGRR